MGRFLFAILLIVAFATVAAAGPADDEFSTYQRLKDAVSAYQRGDDALAARLFSPLAEQGNAQAQSNLGGLYDNGRRVPRTIKRH